MEKEKIKYFAKMGAQSFYEDPLYVNSVAEAKKREKILYHLMMFRLCASEKSDIIVADEKDRGLCVWRWAYKNYSIKDVFNYPKINFYALKYFTSALKIMSFSANTDGNVFDKKTMLIEPVFVGREFQNQGVGFRLIRKKINELESRGISLGLETQNEKDVGFYEKLGFRVIRADHIEKLGINNFYMIRKKDD